MMETSRDTTDLVKEKLREMIFSGDIGRDGKLPTERALSKEFEVGRRHVRTALDRLKDEGLIWRKQGSGTYVGQPTDPTGDLAEKIAGETNALEVMEARLCIEPELAALCARRMRVGEVLQLRTLAQQQFEAPSSERIELWDGAYHRHIAQSARNRPLLTAFALLDKIRANPDWVAIRATARDAASLMVTYREHMTIVDAIESGDPVTARTAMHDHLSTRFDALHDQHAKAAGRLDTTFFNLEDLS